ncbi:MAG TPA: FAD-binding oxidoreductase, partial [Gaiellaceae bacterium]|nr:FAD-binding oxidoreductase [Gaiellaceae bacterium]
MEAPRLNRSLWLAESEPGYPALEGDADDVVDAVVVGAGITGATTAFLLAEAGASVALLDSSRVAHGATGYTTAKLTVGHNIVYRTLVDSYGEEVARRFARSNGEAIERVAGLVARHALDCDFERATNYVYAERPESVPELEEEAEAARAAGVAAELTTVTDLPYPVAAALRVDGQAQFHPWKYVAGLVRLVAERGGRVYELTRATHVAKGDPCVVTTPRGRVRGRHVVLATQLPFLDRGLFFARAHPVKSYAVAAPVPDDVAPRGMYISCDAPTRSVRSAPGPDGARFVIVGGEGHKPGADPATEERYARLEEFLAERFGGAQAEYRWSTHDYVPVDHLPYIGRLRGGDPRILVATGFAKWGMTKGTLAASILADSVLGRPNEYA